MKIKFADQDLARLETDDPPTERFSVSIIKAARRKLNFLRAAHDERDLRNWKSLHYEKLIGDREGQRSIRLNKQWRLILTLEQSDSETVITVHEIVDYH
jgi:proteic killer suppression protein